MFVHARTYVLGLTERCVMCTYVAYVWEQNWQHQTDRETERWQYKAQGIVPHLFLLNKAIWKKQDHSLQSPVWVKNKSIVLIFKFDIVLKSVLDMQ